MTLQSALFGMLLTGMALPGSAFALPQSTPSSRPVAAPNIRFPRVTDIDADGVDEWGLIASSSALTSAVTLPEMDDDEDYANDVQLSFLSLPALFAQAHTSGAEAQAIAGQLLGLISVPKGAMGFVPEQQWATGHQGECTVHVAGSVSNSSVETDGYLRAWYRSRPPRRHRPTANNNWATVSSFLYFLAAGTPIEVLGESNGELDCSSTFDQYLGPEGFRHRILIGDSDIQVHHAGGGVFILYGCLADSDELDNTQSSVPYYNVTVGGVNHLLTATQRIPIDSGNQIAIASEVLQHSVTSAGRGPVAIDGDVDHQVGQTLWIWSFTTHGWFFGKDLARNDAPASAYGALACNCQGSSQGGPGF